MADQSPGTRKPPGETLLSLDLKKTMSYTFSQISTSAIILIFRHKGGLQTDELLKIEGLKPNPRSLCLEQSFYHYAKSTPILSVVKAMFKNTTESDCTY